MKNEKDWSTVDGKTEEISIDRVRRSINFKRPCEKLLSFELTLCRHGIQSLIWLVLGQPRHRMHKSEMQRDMEKERWSDGEMKRENADATGNEHRLNFPRCYR